MPITCDRHPTQPAWWKCPRCYKSYCPQCISKRTGGHFQEITYYFCPKCNVEAKPHDLSQVITPFWARLHKFFVYPVASIQSIGLILALSLLSTLFSQPGLFSFFLKFVLWSVMVKYSFESLKSTAEGSFRPPPLSSKVLAENYGIVFKQIALYFSLTLLFLFFVIKAGPLMMLLFVVGCGIGLPAMLIILIINDNLGQALNPVMIIGLISRIGGSYFLLLFFLLLLSGAPAALAFAILQHLPEKLQIFTMATANNYYTLITYHMMGYVILQYHHRVGYPVELETVLASIYPSTAFPASSNAMETVNKPQHEDLLSEISLLVQEGNLEQAVNCIEQRVQIEDIDDLELAERYIGLLKMLKQHPKFLDFAPRYLELTAKSGQKTKASTVYLECLRIDKTFTPQALVLFKIAGWMDELKKHKEAIFALNSLIKSYPKDVLVPKAYYRAAQIFYDRLNNAEQSKKILNGLVRKFPDHEITAFAKSYLNKLSMS